MTRTEVISAFKHYGGIATARQIKEFVGSNQQHVIERMIKWKEIKSIPNHIHKKGGQANILELIIEQIGDY